MDPPREPLFSGMGTPPSRPTPDPFALLYRAYFGFVLRMVRSAGVRDGDAADVVQNVFVTLIYEIGRDLDTSAPLWGWLRTTSIRKARDHLARAYHREEPTEDVIETADDRPDPEQTVQAIDEQQTVEAILDTLPDEQRVVLVLSDAEEMPMPEIAAALKIPLGTGYTRLRAARRSFARAWDERRASGALAVLPFAAWDARSLFRASRFAPAAPPGLEDEVWRRLASAVGSGLAGAGGAAAGGAAVGGAAAAGAAKVGVAGVVLTAKQLAVGVIVSALVGAGAYAALRPATQAPEVATTASAVGARGRAASPVAVTTVTASEAPAAAAALADAPVVSPTAAGAPTAATSAPRSPQLDEAEERTMLDGAWAALERANPEPARAALRRSKSPRFAEDREELRRLLRA